MKFAEILKSRRKEIGYTQEQVASHLGINGVNVSDWERGKTMPEASRIPKLAKFLRLSISELMGDAPVPTITGDSGVWIPRYDWNDAAAQTILIRDQPGEILEWRVEKEWLSANVRKYSDIDNLRILAAFGEAMSPAFSAGDPLLLDIGAVDSSIDGIFLFRIGAETYIRRIQNIPGKGPLATCENKAFEPWEISSSMNFHVLGRVLIAWRKTQWL